jgi:uracil-DNA glycosylase family 4
MSSDWAASTLRWWSDAGVDVIVGEEPRDWLAPAARKPLGVEPSRPKTEPPRPKEAGPLPSDLPEFQAWFVGAEDLPGSAPSAPRLGPSGNPQSKLMVLTDFPTLEDLKEGKMVSSQGLFDKMLAAIGFDRESIYLASLSPFRPPSANLGSEAARRCGAVALHHVGLVAPRALLLLGDVCARTLLGGAVSQTRSKWHEIETKGGRIRALVSMKPESLNLQPNLKKHAWADLQLLKEGL